MMKITFVFQWHELLLEASAQLLKLMLTAAAWFQTSWIPGGGGTPDFKWRGWSKNFLGFEIFDSEIFLGRKIWQVFLWGGLI